MAKAARIVTGGLLMGAGAAVLAGPPSTSKVEKVLPPSATTEEIRDWLNTIRVGDGLEVSVWAQVCGTIAVMTDESDNEFLIFLVRLIEQGIIGDNLSENEMQEVVNATKAAVPFHLVNDGEGSFVFEDETQDGYDLCHRRIVTLFQKTFEAHTGWSFHSATLQGAFLADIYNETIGFYRRFKYGQGFVKAMCSVLATQPDGTALADKLALKWFGREIEVPLRGMVATENMDLPLIPPHKTVLMGFEGILPDPILLYFDFSDPADYTILVSDVSVWGTVNLKAKNGLMGRTVNEVEAATLAVREKIKATTAVEFITLVIGNFRQIIANAAVWAAEQLAKAAGINPEIVQKGSSLLGAGLIVGGGYLVASSFTKG